MSAFYAGMAEIFEIDEADVTPDLDLASHTWDSLAIVSTIALIDECYNELLGGKALAQCVTIADIEQLVSQASAKVA